jgi:hypothetical protein
LQEQEERAEVTILKDASKLAAHVMTAEKPIDIKQGPTDHQIRMKMFQRVSVPQFVANESTQTMITSVAVATPETKEAPWDSLDPNHDKSCISENRKLTSSMVDEFPAQVKTLSEDTQGTSTAGEVASSPPSTTASNKSLSSILSELPEELNDTKMINESSEEHIREAVETLRNEKEEDEKHAAKEPLKNISGRNIDVIEDQKGTSIREVTVIPMQTVCEGFSDEKAVVKKKADVSVSMLFDSNSEVGESKKNDDDKVISLSSTSDIKQEPKKEDSS